VTTSNADAALQSDVCLDLMAIVDDSADGRLIGSEETTLEAVEFSDWDSFIVTLDNGQRFRVTVREERR